MLYRITAPHFCAGVIVWHGQASGGADILRYMRGWSLWQIIKYCKHRGWILEQVPLSALKVQA